MHRPDHQVFGTEVVEAKPFIMLDLHLSRRIQHAVTGFILLLISYIIPPYPIGFILLSIATAAFYHLHWKRVHDETWDRWYLDKFGKLLRDHERGEWEDVANAAAAAAKDVGTKSPPINNNNGRRRRISSPALPGAFYFLLGTTLSTLLFPIVVAQTSLLILSLADPMAGIVGVWFSQYLNWNITWKQLLRRPRDGSKLRSVGEGPSVAGSVACAITSILCTYVYISIGNDSTISDASRSSISLSFHSRVRIGIMTAVAEAMSGRNDLPFVGTVLVDDNLTIPLVVGCLIYLLNGV
jgi:dolichol kinase